MTSFDFQLRTRVIFGPGGLSRIGELARELGFRRTLLVADRGMVKAGYVNAAVKTLEAAGIAAIPFHDFRENPDCAMVEAGRAFADPLGLDSLIGLGGGSSLDCAKGINFLLTNGGTMRDYRGYGKAARPLLPMIGIPTTAGTGSEAQSYAVISDAASHMKMACGDPSAAVRIAILDPELTMSAPRTVTAMSGFDAIAHAVETWVTIAPHSTVGHVLAAGLGASEPVIRARACRIRTMLRHARRCCSASHFAGIAIEQSMLGAAHACANPLTARFGLAHGLALSILLPHVVRWNASIVGDRYAALDRIRGSPGHEAGAVCAQPEGWGALSTITACQRDALPGLADQAATQWTGTFNPRPFDAAGALEIYRAAH